jgi:3-(3-hydroxy-phenyl)propionate hydroxylase
MTAATIGAGERRAVFRFGYRRSPDQDRPARHSVVVVGAGPVGLALAIDLRQRGVQAIVLDDADRIGEGSRAICFAKRTLEIFDRLGLGDGLVESGVTWKLGRVFHGDGELYHFDLLPEDGHRRPAFINIQQYYVEGALVERAADLGLDVRWKNRVVALTQNADRVALTIETPEGPYTLHADRVVAADGARSSIRDLMGLTFRGETFEDRFLIADVKMQADYPTERWFWFDPPFHAGQSALLHRQPDNVWRIDLQLGPDADVDLEQKPERVMGRLRRMLGERDFSLEWVSVYRFNCRRLDRFVHDRVIFVGDAAHQVSPFGARGANSGIQDAENLSWKLAAVIAGTAPASLIDTYDSERVAAADENIGHSTRATDFIAPRTLAERRLRNAALALASRAPFARRLINSGRLSTPTTYTDTPLSTRDSDRFAGTLTPGAPLPDAPLTRADGTPVFLTEAMPAAFHLIAFGAAPEDLPTDLPVLVVGRDLIDGAGLLARRLDATPGSAYLVRPDQHLAARWRQPTGAAIRAALDRAMGHGGLSPATAPARGEPGVALSLDARLADPDRAYAALTAAHRGLTDVQAADLDARLVLILMNQIGDEAVIAEALALARQTGDRQP